MDERLAIFFTDIDDLDIQSIAADIAEDIAVAKWEKAQHEKPQRIECSQGVITRMVQCGSCGYMIGEEFYPTHLFEDHRLGY